MHYSSLWERKELSHHSHSRQTCLLFLYFCFLQIRTGHLKFDKVSGSLQAMSFRLPECIKLIESPVGNYGKNNKPNSQMSPTVRSVSEKFWPKTTQLSALLNWLKCNYLGCNFEVGSIRRTCFWSGSENLLWPIISTENHMESRSTLADTHGVPLALEARGANPFQPSLGCHSWTNLAPFGRTSAHDDIIICLVSLVFWSQQSVRCTNHHVLLLILGFHVPFWFWKVLDLQFSHSKSVPQKYFILDSVKQPVAHGHKKVWITTTTTKWILNEIKRILWHTDWGLHIL